MFRFVVDLDRETLPPPRRPNSPFGLKPTTPNAFGAVYLLLAETLSIDMSPKPKPPPPPITRLSDILNSTPPPPSFVFTVPDGSPFSPPKCPSSRDNEPNSVIG